MLGTRISLLVLRDAGAHAGRVSRRVLGLYVFLALAWGVPYLLIKVVVREVDPALLVLCRAGGGALVLLAVPSVRRQLGPVLRRWRPVLAFAAAEFAVPYFFLASAERTLPSSTTGLLMAAVPLAGVVVGFVLGTRDRLSATTVVGLLVGIAGVALLVGLDVRGSDLPGVAQLALVVLGYAVGAAILTRWLAGVGPAAVTAVALGVTGLAYLPIVAARGAWPTALPSTAALAALLVLTVVCTACAFVALAVLVGAMGAVRATTVTYLNPAVALLAGALVLGEQVRAVTLVGFAVILAGCVLTTRRPRRAPLVTGEAPVPLVGAGGS